MALLFTADAGEASRARRDAVQIGLSDDPDPAVRQADELVAQIMKRLARTLSSQRAKIEGQFSEGDAVDAESQRVALRRYLSLVQRLLFLDRPPVPSPDRH